MPEHQPLAISEQERRDRIRRVRLIARRLGFVGRVEYRHVYSQSGGAQFCVGPSAEADQLVVYAEAFERDEDPDDFSMEAIPAHERGHQLLCRNERLRRLLAGRTAGTTEEVLASVLASLMVDRDPDRVALLMKATAEAVDHGMKPSAASGVVEQLRSYLEKFL